MMSALQAYDVFTSALRSSPPDRASSCAAVTSSDISIPDIFCTTSFRTSKSKLFPALSWFATYCRRPVSSIEYLRKTVPQNTAKPEKKEYTDQVKQDRKQNSLFSCCAKDVLLRQVVQKPVNANPGLKVNWRVEFSCIKMFFTNILRSLRLFKLKTEEQTI